jgi:hypothetical protein
VVVPVILQDGATPLSWCALHYAVLAFVLIKIYIKLFKELTKCKRVVASLTKDDLGHGHAKFFIIDVARALWALREIVYVGKYKRTA